LAAEGLVPIHSGDFEVGSLLVSGTTADVCVLGRVEPDGLELGGWNVEGQD